MSLNIEELITRSFVNETTIEENERIKQWLKESDDNLILYRDLESIHKFRFIETYQGVSDIIWRDLENSMALTNHKAESINRSIKSYIYPLLAVASLVILVLVTPHLFSGVPSNPLLESDSFAQSKILVPKGGFASITLPDGSTVDLQENSSLQYRYSSQQDSLVVSFHGQGQFHVFKNKSRIFHVVTSVATIDVVGTTFLINDNTQDNICRVILAEGAINLYLNSDVEGPYKMSPLDGVDIEMDALSLTKYSVSSSIGMAIEERELKVENMYLSELINYIETIYLVKIELMNSRVKNICYTGTLFLDKNIQDLMDVINYNADFKYAFVENDKINIW